MRPGTQLIPVALAVYAVGISLLLLSRFEFTSVLGDVNARLCEKLYQVPSISRVNSLHQNPHLDYTNVTCDPYLEYGYPTLNNQGEDLIATNYWTSYNPDCRTAPRFMRDVVDRKPLPWLQNKTCLLLGDSVDRFNLDHFCVLAGDHETGWLDPTFQIEEDGHMVETDKPAIRFCFIKEYNFMLVEFLTYIQMEDDWVWPWTMSGRFRRPRMIEQQVPHYKQIMDSLGRSPDLVVTGGGLWDLAAWSRKDAVESRPVQGSTPPDRLETWLARARIYADLIKENFPNSLHMMRLLHRVRQDRGLYHLPHDAVIPADVDRTERYEFSDERLLELNQLYKQLMKERPEIYPFTWGELLSGNMEGLLDHIHPGLGFAVLYSDMLLYYLSRLKEAGGHVSS